MKKIEFIKKDKIEINNILKALLDDGYKIVEDEEYKYYLENSKILKDFNIYYFLYFSVDEEKKNNLKEDILFFKEIIKEELKTIKDELLQNIKEYKKENKYKLSKEQFIEFNKNIKKVEKEILEKENINDKKMKDLYQINYLINIIKKYY